MEINYKVPGGKLLRISTTIKNDIIESITLYGDFFLHPEEAVVDIEKVLLNKKIDDIANTLEVLFKEKSIRAIGFSPRDVEDAIMQSIHIE
ncbi:MAG: lipoate protein ligase C-terminal domain-containing protein [Candidatus Woesearchaeota archaeon]